VSALVPTSAVPAAVANVVITFGVAAVYLYIGYRLSQRRVSAGSRLASYQFSLWWGGLGITVALGGIELALAIAGALPFALALTFYFFTDLVDCFFLWGLVGFLVYVYTGRYHLIELTLFYAVFYFTVVYFVFLRVPSSVVLVAGQPALAYSVAPVPVLELVIILGLLGPEIVGAILYLSLLRRTDDPARRFRIWMVGGGILLWWVLEVFLPSSTPGWALARGILTVVPGLMSLIAFYPPEWAQRRFGVQAEARPEPGQEAVAGP
jgi:hypothetical protein